MSALQELAQAKAKLDEYRRYHRIESYRPYPFQRDFHHKKGKDTDQIATQVGAIMANQIGKSTAGAAEAAYHATGEYPDWWKGLRFRQPVTLLCAGVSADTTKRIIQGELLGGMDKTPEFGTGMLPKDKIKSVTRRAGIADAYETIKVKGKYGISTIWLMSYEQQWQKFQGIRFEYAWVDEEPPEDIWGQLIRGTISRANSRIAMTMTPESGITKIVDNFLHNLTTGQALVTATWEDARHEDGSSHLTKEKMAEKLSQLLPHERDLRSRGLPSMGAGLIFQTPEDKFVIEPRPIPTHWARGIGIDFGINHPFGAALLAWDREADVMYLTADYRQSGVTPPIHADAIRRWGNWLPVFWPHDGITRDKGSGIPLSDMYRDQGLKLHWEKFSNPPSIGQKEGQGGQGVEVGLLEIRERLESGRFKVFDNCTSFLEEYRIYHRDKDGKIVSLRDDVMAAVRYGVQMRRFFQTKSFQDGGKIEYTDSKAIV